MPEEQTGLSTFDVFSIGFKVMGLSLLFMALSRFISTIGVAALSYSVPYANIYVHPMYDLAALASPFSRLVIAGFLLFYGDMMARRFSTTDDVVSSPRVGLCAAAKMAGVYIVATGIPRVIEYVTSAFNLGMRTSQMDGVAKGIYNAFLPGGLDWPQICRIGCGLIVGVYLIYGARHLLDLAYGRLPYVEEAEEVV